MSLLLFTKLYQDVQPRFFAFPYSSTLCFITHQSCCSFFSNRLGKASSSGGNRRGSLTATPVSAAPLYMIQARVNSHGVKFVHCFPSIPFLRDRPLLWVSIWFIYMGYYLVLVTPDREMEGTVYGNGKPCLVQWKIPYGTMERVNGNLPVFPADKQRSPAVAGLQRDKKLVGRQQAAQMRRFTPHRETP